MARALRAAGAGHSGARRRRLDLASRRPPGPVAVGAAAAGAVGFLDLALVGAAWALSRRYACAIPEDSAVRPGRDDSRVFRQVSGHPKRSDDCPCPSTALVMGPDRRGAGARRGPPVLLIPAICAAAASGGGARQTGGRPHRRDGDARSQFSAASTLCRGRSGASSTHRRDQGGRVVVVGPQHGRARLPGYLQRFGAGRWRS